MDGEQKTQRRSFLKWLAAIIGLFFCGAWYNLVSSRIRSLKSGKRLIYLPDDVPRGVSFADSVIINKTGTGIHVFSSRCSHLGCDITVYDGDELVCPCHGSRYTAEGKVVQGPAVRDLDRLNYDEDKEEKRIVVYLSH